MVILALLEIAERDAADVIIETVCAGIPVRQRLRRATQRIIATRGDAVAVRFAVLARRDRDEMERRMRERRM